MSTTRLHDWLAESSEQARLFEQETLILDVTEAIWAEMDHQGISKADLAARLGKSRAFVTQVLNGSRNMTLRTLSDIAFALGVRADFTLGHPVQGADGWTDSGETRFGPRLMTRVCDLNAANTDWTDLEAQRS